MSTWRTPQLIHLVRGRPEEAILLACKSYLLSAGPSNANDGCVFGRPAGSPCGPSANGVSLNAIVCYECDVTTAS